MKRWFGLLLVCVVGLAIPVPGEAASDQAMKLRAEAGLAPFTPPEPFLSANFVADEVDPAVIFGTVDTFAKGLSCPASWLIEEGEQARLSAHKPESGPFEYTLVLEADCPGAVSHYVFLDRSEAAAHWLEWRKLFHKSKAEPQYSQARAELEKAATDGVTVAAELRFIERNGDLQLKKPEEILLNQLKVKPIYDLKHGKVVTP